MTLDITKIAAQIGEMAGKIRHSQFERQEHLKAALAKIADGSINPTVLKQKIRNAETPWPVAQIYRELNARYPAPESPREYAVLASDGSNIDVDRHKAARCYLINIGTVDLRYGQKPAAELENTPYLYSDEEELVIKNERNKRRQQQIEGALLDARRSVEEGRSLARLASSYNGTAPVLAFLDGSLVLFGLESFPDYVQSYLLDEAYLKSLDQLQAISQQHPLTLASYISLPGSAEVVNALRVAICPQEKADCDRTCSEGEPACDAFAGLNDRLLFNDYLQTGERSALFINPSHILERYGRHRVYFFYLKLEDEIARVEVPEWVAVNQGLLELTHALVIDQCRKGQGYPVALAEAHEQAVVTGADREEFWSLVDQTLNEQRLPVYTSIKSRSKKTGWI